MRHYNSSRRYVPLHHPASWAFLFYCSPIGAYVVSGDADGRVFIWDWKSCKIYKKFQAHEKVLFPCSHSVLYCAPNFSLQACMGVEWHPVENSKLASAGAKSRHTTSFFFCISILTLRYRLGWSHQVLGLMSAIFTVRFFLFHGYCPSYFSINESRSFADATQSEMIFAVIHTISFQLLMNTSLIHNSRTLRERSAAQSLLLTSKRSNNHIFFNRKSWSQISQWSQRITIRPFFHPIFLKKPILQ